ncbi:type IV secretion system DNA-binding domain-containing protein [Propionivibrio sp.]|uniref:type IV secretory system conjugative DNA transfer family protein n=1 Tax=Propionivibrio sp. TaxID=2212460 RepID=UPI00260A37A7|nr:type IV secretion system DNA-binding domain-containing protein [Propionivibrio sp.]
MNIRKEPKPKWMLPGDQTPLDTTIPTVHVGSALMLGVLTTVIAVSLILLLSWANYPLFPVPPSERPPIFHVQAFWQVLAGLISKLFQGDMFHYYRAYLFRLNQSGMGDYLAYRWLIALIGGIACGGWVFWKSLKPVGGVRHVKGKELLEGKIAYQSLKREFNFLCRHGHGSRLVMAADSGFDPTNPLHFTPQHLKSGRFIEKPEALRRSHTLYIGGTGRGKTQLIYFLEVAQVYQHIRNGDRVKLLIADTPKSDYCKYFHSSHIVKIAPHEHGGVCWDIATDLRNPLVAHAFWKGKIPLDDKDSIWPLAAISVCTGATKVLQVLAPKVWNYGMLAYLLGKSGEELSGIVGEHYPEAKQVLNSARETLTSVMFNLGTHTADIIQLGRIYDCYDSKVAIHQASSQALKSPAYLNFISVQMGYDPMNTENETAKMKKAVHFKGVCRFLNQTQPDWQWKDFSRFIKQPIDEQKVRIFQCLTGNEKGFLMKSGFMDDWKSLCATVVQYADEWDQAEARKKFSIRSWIKHENPKRKVLILKPSESFPSLTEGLIKGILYFANSVILGDLADSRSRRFHILIDEFQSYGNIEPFTAPALSLYRSRGVSLSLAMQDLAQLVKIYGQEFVDFMTSNTGSLYVLGIQDGFSANKFSELLGEKTIAKLHRSVSHSDGGKSTSIDEQHHQEKVMGANEFNLLGANEATRTITYLALFAKQNPAYILTAPILPYKTRAESKPAAWIDALPSRPLLPDMDRYWDSSQDSYQPPQRVVSPNQGMIDDQIDHIYDGYQEDLEREFASQTEADRLGITEPVPFAMYQED